LGRPKIEVSGLCYRVGKEEILREVDAWIPEGEMTVLVGPSGAGKSTVLRAINRLIEPSDGEVYLDGSPTSAMNPLELRRRVGMVFQLPALSGETVEEAVLYGPRLAHREADAPRLLEAVGLSPALAKRNPQNLSVGQQQRISIARALALEPEVLLMDEPTSALDEAARRRIEELIRNLNERLGLTIVLVSHDLSQVERVADSVLFLAGGRCEGPWSKEEFFSGKSGRHALRRISGRA
jgi:ABC-type methionine transport system ATPase subunit